MSFKFGRSVDHQGHLNTIFLANEVFIYNDNVPALITRPGGVCSIVISIDGTAAAAIEAKAGDYRPKTFTVASDTLETLTCTAHAYQDGDGPLRVTNSGGALPTGLAVNTNYWINVVDANTISLHVNKQDALNDVNRVNITGNGTGTHTIGGMGTGATPMAADPTGGGYNALQIRRGGAEAPAPSFVFEMPDRLTIRGLSASAVLVRYWFPPESE